MIIPTIGRYAIIFQLAAHGALRVHAASFRGATAAADLGVVGETDSPNTVITAPFSLIPALTKRTPCAIALQPDPCAGKNSNQCDGGCAWDRGSCVSVSTPSSTNPLTVAQQTYCGCPQCTASIWNTVACKGSECYTCGNRITFMQSFEGGSLPESEACTYVAKEFPEGPCGPECNPEMCIPDDPTSAPTPNLTTTEPTKSPSDVPTNPPTPLPSMTPTNEPTTAEPTPNPSKNPTTPTVAQKTYCGCPQCMASIWNTDACKGSECYTCGSRITFMQSFDGGSMSESEACTYVAKEFPNGPCGPECNPEMCIPDDPTSAPTPSPTTAEPTKSPSDVTPSPTPPPNGQSFCGCASCTTAIWNHSACNGSECYTCGSRISFLQTTGKTEEEACTQVSNEFPNNECGPDCNPLLCNPDESSVLDEPDEANLIWNDEFDVDGAPDSTKWGYDLGDGCSAGICKWGNNEEQVYTNDPSNVIVSDGILRISAKRTSPQPDYTSTRMVTRGKQVFKYGRIRFRASVANCQAFGTWPALWMLPEDWVYGGWPKSGEIDVMETVGHEADKFFGTVHTEAYNHGIGTERGGSLIKSKDKWYIFEIDWQADNIRFAVNKQVFYQFTPGDVSDYKQWPFDQDFHLLMNIAVGGAWGAVEGVDAASFEGAGQTMEVDWVRVYSN